MEGLRPEDIREYSTEELYDKIEDLDEQYRKMKFAHSVSPLENPLQLRWTRRDYARLKTELKRRQLEKQENNQ